MMILLLLIICWRWLLPIIIIIINNWLFDQQDYVCEFIDWSKYDNKDNETALSSNNHHHYCNIIIAIIYRLIYDNDDDNDNEQHWLWLWWFWLSINQPINEWMNEWSRGLDGQRCVWRQHATKKKWSDIWSMNTSLIFISEINRHIPTPPTITMTSNDIAAQFVISHFIIIIINEWMNEWMNGVIGWLINEWIIIIMMMIIWLGGGDDEKECVAFRSRWSGWRVCR